MILVLFLVLYVLVCIFELYVFFSNLLDVCVWGGGVRVLAEHL
jgi:hypothetical protein